MARNETRAAAAPDAAAAATDPSADIPADKATAPATTSPPDTSANGVTGRLTIVLNDPHDVRLVNILATALGVSRAEVARRGVRAYAAQERPTVERVLRDMSTGLGVTGTA